jgi:hypothetical protein
MYKEKKIDNTQLNRVLYVGIPLHTTPVQECPLYTARRGSTMREQDKPKRSVRTRLSVVAVVLAPRAQDKGAPHQQQDQRGVERRHGAKVGGKLGTTNGYKARRKTRRVYMHVMGTKKQAQALSTGPAPMEF